MRFKVYWNNEFVGHVHCSNDNTVLDPKVRVLVASAGKNEFHEALAELRRNTKFNGITFREYAGRIEHI